ncbi:MAG: aminotransferase class V-fold PLP-dependent enzyme [Flavobacteriaceae bacterium]
MQRNIEQIREDFPILNREVNKRPLVYLDNAATAQTPVQVIETIEKYYKNDNANIHRGVHFLSQKATDAYEQARIKVQKFINAPLAHEVIFTTGTTMGINLVANGLNKMIHKGDEILISTLEHHANIVPWQMLCERTGAVLKVIELKDDGTLSMESFDALLSAKTKVLAVSHVSNTLGTVNPIEEFINKAHKVGALVLIDGAQATPHMKVDVQALNCDFYVSSGHKMYGPTGVGFLYGKEALLNKMEVYQGGGEMIAEVTFDKTTYAELPHKFEAGTPNIAGGIGLGAAVDYMEEIGVDYIAQREQELHDYAMEQMKQFDDIDYYGTAENKASVISFNLRDVHPYDVGVIIDKLGVAVRTGHHCTQPLMQRFEIPGTVRASFAFYNTKEDVDRFIEALAKARMMLK